MQDKYKNVNYYRLSSLYSAAFLLSKGLELISIDRIEDSHKAVFIFNNPVRAEELIRQYNFGAENSMETMVDVRKFIVAIKSIKEKLYQY